MSGEVGVPALAGPVELILFDAVKTLIEAFPSVGEVYQRAGYQHGCNATQFQLEARMILAMHDVHLLRRWPQGLKTNEAFEKECWQETVRGVFSDLPAHLSDSVFKDLWNHFAEPQHWRLFPDVAPTIAELRRRGYRIGIASNFDQRLLNICRAHQPLTDLDWIFVSSQVGWSKPAQEFYREVERLTGLAPQRIMLVGDDCEHDYVVPQNCGWQARWLVRQAAESSRGQIRSLDELLGELL